jgi:Trk K+ transport system NAD-binding subunit
MHAGWLDNANLSIALALAAGLLALKKAGEEVVCIDSNPRACQEAEALGLSTIHGNANDERVLQRAEVEASM